MENRTGRTIGLILANASSSFTTAFMDLFQQELYQKDYKLVIGLTNHDLEKERFYLEFFGLTTEGIIILSDSSEYRELADAIAPNIPVVFIHRAPADCEHTSIIESDYSATFQAVLSLVNSGYPKTALICRNIKFSTSREIIQAYRAAMETTPEGFHEDWIFECNTTDRDYIENLTSHITGKGCTGLLAASIEVTERLAPYIYEYNKLHDAPLSLTGFSTENRRTVLFKSLDTICRPIHRTVDLALQQLFYLMSNPDAPQNEYIVKGSLKIRTSDVFQTLS